jgi:ubiquinone/menaquinone biosynthesis C-methylase UbiE
MKKIHPRIPEGGAIEDTSEMTMEQYSELMKKQLWKEYVRFADEVVEEIQPDKNSKVLEIGSGSGWAGIILLKKRTDLLLEGLEPSLDMIRVAIANATKEGLENRFEFKAGNGEDMKEMKDGDYDLVISRESLHHWDDPEKVFLEIKRVLKPSGKIFIHDFRRDMSIFGRLIVNIISKFLPYNMGKHWKASIAASYTPDEIKEILAKIDCKEWQVSSDLMDLIIYKN